MVASFWVFMLNFRGTYVATCFGSSPAQELLESDGFATPSDPTALAADPRGEVRVCSLVVEHIGSFP